MGRDKTDKAFEDFAKEVWGKRAENLPVPGFDLTRHITYNDVLYMLRHYSFIQIVDADAIGAYSTEVKVTKAKTGWPIVDYGNAISTSPGEALFDRGRFTIDEQGNYQRQYTGLGTRTKQIVDTAKEIVDRMAERGGKNILIVGNEELMRWAVWAAATERGLKIVDYTPSKKDIDKYNRIQSEFKSLVQPAPPPPEPKS